MKTVLLLTALLIFLLESCTIEKRLYRPGYYIEWAHSKKMPPLQKHGKSEPIVSSKSKYHQTELTDKVAESPKEPAKNFELSEKRIVLAQPEQPTKDLSKSKIAPEHELRGNTFQTSDSNSFREQEKKESGDAIMYLAAVLMSLASMGAILSNRKSLMKLTRWAKSNPKQTQWFIAGIELPLMGVGILAGYNAKQMGYELSDTMNYVFAAMLVLGFLTVPFRFIKRTITLPSQLNKQRLGYLGITMAALMLMTGLGNRLPDKYPNNPVTHIVKAIDHTIIGESSSKYSDPASQEKINSGIQEKRAAEGGGLAVLAVFLIILLLAAICAGVCIAILGGTIVYFGLGLVIVALSIWGIVALAKSKWLKKSDASN